VTGLIFVYLARYFGASTETILALAIFAAAPPLSSATNLAFILRYKTLLTLQFSFSATLLLPIFGPLTLVLVGIDADISTLNIGMSISLMLLGGFVIGISFQFILTRERILRNDHSFNGLATIVLIAFLFPILDGVVDYILEEIEQAIILLLLALLLNFGSHIAIKKFGTQLFGEENANTAGLLYANRNLAFYLAILPANPALSLFVAAAQVPIYTTPAIFRRDQSDQ
jgi:hypothetical protein